MIRSADETNNPANVDFVMILLPTMLLTVALLDRSRVSNSQVLTDPLWIGVLLSDSYFFVYVPLL
jgi:hypothetical protein